MDSILYDYKKAFNSIEHFEISQAAWNEINSKVIECIMYRKAIARIHLDNHAVDGFEIQIGVRQWDSTCMME